MKTVVGLFDQIEAAHAAVQDLRDLGLPSSAVSLVAHDATGEYGQALTGEASPAAPAITDATAAGAGMGVVLGGLAGLLVGLGALILPGIGPVLAAGPLAAVLSGLVGAGLGAVGGGLAGGLIGALIDLGVPEDQAQYYAEGLRRGGALVTAHVADHQEHAARARLNRHHPVEVERRVAAWRAAGWTGYDPTSPPFSPEQLAAERRAYAPVEAPAVDTEAPYRQHHADIYSETGRDFDDYRPAYAYGQLLFTDPRFLNLDWDELEPEAQRDWEARFPHATWADFKAAVRIAWESVKATIR